MKTNERFLEALWYEDCTMRADNAIGNQWKYCNQTSKKAKGFEEARAQGKFLCNCVDAVIWACKMAGIPGSALSWYGADGKIAWLNKNAKSEALMYFSIIETGGKTVNQLYKAGRLYDGDILLGYQGMAHTNVYTGDLSNNPMSFDSGHANCSGSGEGAKFKRWVSGLTHKNKKVNWILRINDRAHYRVQAGAFSDLAEFKKMERYINSKGFPTALVMEDGMYKIQCGHYSGKSNANRYCSMLNKSGVSAFVKEI